VATRSISRSLCALAGLTSATVLLVACSSSSKSSSSSSSSSSTTGGTSAIAVPAKLKSAGKMVVCADASYAPMEFFGSDNKTVIGADADLAAALGKELGIPAQVQNLTFDSIIPALGSRCDIGMSSFSVTLARQAQVDFVSYATAGSSFMVQTGKNPELTTLDALCGKTVAVEKGVTQADDANAQSKKCTDAGKKGVTVLTFPDQNGANLALTSGRADVGMADSPVAAYIAKQSNGAITVIGTPYGAAPYGIAVPKTADYQGLTTALQTGLQNLAKDGTYLTILKKWGIEAGAITTFTINGATS